MGGVRWCTIALRGGFVKYPAMRITLEIPGPLFRKAKANAAERGMTLREFVNDALREKLSSKTKAGSTEPTWIKFFGAGKPFVASIRAIDRVVEREFRGTEKN